MSARQTRRQRRRRSQGLGAYDERAKQRLFGLNDLERAREDAANAVRADDGRELGERLFIDGSDGVRSARELVIDELGG